MTTGNTMRKSSAHARRRRLLRGGLPALALLAAAAAPAAAEPMKLRYNIYVSGSKAMKMTYEGNVTRSSYDMNVSIKPAGFLSFFIKKSYFVSGSGRIVKGRPAPARFTMVIKKKKSLRTGKIVWSGGKMNWTRTPPLPAALRAKILKAGGRAPDPLAMLAGMAMTDPAKGCRGRVRIFDGHDVYDLKLSLGGKKRFASGIYRGTAVLCRMKHVPIVGMSEKKMRKALADPWRFNVWLAPVMTKDAGRLMVPVEAFGRVKGHNFTATLKRASVGGRPLSASGGR